MLAYLAFWEHKGWWIKKGLRLIDVYLQMVPIPEGAERDEEEPKDDESDTSLPSGTEVGTVKVKIARWVHNGQGELDMIE